MYEDWSEVSSYENGKRSDLSWYVMMTRRLDRVAPLLLLIAIGFV
jgi:hypothetical protein